MVGCERRYDKKDGETERGGKGVVSGERTAKEMEWGGGGKRKMEEWYGVKKDITTKKLEKQTEGEGGG